MTIIVELPAALQASADWSLRVEGADARFGEPVELARRLSEVHLHIRGAGVVDDVVWRMSATADIPISAEATLVRLVLFAVTP